MTIARSPYSPGCGVLADACDPQAGLPNWALPTDARGDLRAPDAPGGQESAPVNGTRGKMRGAVLDVVNRPVGIGHMTSVAEEEVARASVDTGDVGGCLRRGFSDADGVCFFAGNIVRRVGQRIVIADLDVVAPGGQIEAGALARRDIIAAAGVVHQRLIANGGIRGAGHGEIACAANKDVARAVGIEERRAPDVQYAGLSPWSPLRAG